MAALFLFSRPLMNTLSHSVPRQGSRRRCFSTCSDDRLLALSEECWGRRLMRLAALLDDLLIERQAQQLPLPLDPDLEMLLPF